MPIQYQAEPILMQAAFNLWDTVVEADSTLQTAYPNK